MNDLCPSSTSLSARMRKTFSQGLAIICSSSDCISSNVYHKGYHRQVKGSNLKNTTLHRPISATAINLPSQEQVLGGAFLAKYRHRSKVSTPVGVAF